VCPGGGSDALVWNPVWGIGRAGILECFHWGSNLPLEQIPHYIMPFFFFFLSNAKGLPLATTEDGERRVGFPFNHVCWMGSSSRRKWQDKKKERKKSCWGSSGFRLVVVCLHSITFYYVSELTSSPHDRRDAWCTTPWYPCTCLR
jgi:hypothetical protein